MTKKSSSEELVLPLTALIRSRMERNGWSYTDLARRSGDNLTRARWQQLGSGRPPRKFPDPSSLVLIATALDVDQTTVVLAAARSVGLEVRTQRGELADLLPAGTERLSPAMRDAILDVVRAAVAAADTGQAPCPDEDVVLEWAKADAPSTKPSAAPDGGGYGRT